MKYLLLFAFLFVIWWAWKKRAGAEVQKGARRSPAPEKMLVCAHCGVHLPESEAVSDGSRNYCCDAHRQAARGVSGE